MGAGAKTVAIEARLAKATTAAERAEIALAKVENSFYADGENPANWTNGKPADGSLNLATHWNKHSTEFPELKTANDYYRATQNFATNPPAGTLTKTAGNGDKLFYNPVTNTFAVTTKDGLPRTMFKPSPAQHGFSTNLDFWNSK